MLSWYRAQSLRDSGVSGWKGGIGTSSRVLPEALGGYTIGVLVDGEPDSDPQHMLYNKDKRINKLERKIRRRVVSHLSVRGSRAEVPSALIFMNNRYKIDGAGIRMGMAAGGEALIPFEVAGSTRVDEDLDDGLLSLGPPGVGVALRDAASRGLRTLLVERSDFAAGTSSRSPRAATLPSSRRMSIP